jgi:rubrerythrin
MRTYSWNDRLPDRGPWLPQDARWECNVCGEAFDETRDDERPVCPSCGSEEINEG